MRRIGVAPMGLTYFFLIASRLEASPGDFASSAEYESYLRQRATHPASALHILRVAEGIGDRIDAFARLQADPPSSKKKLQALQSERRAPTQQRFDLLADVRPIRFGR